MDINATESTTSLAEEMAQITCELARNCSAKENYFASLFDLTPAEFKCLKLFAAQKVLSIKEIIYHMEITPGRITHILTSLEAKKYVLRKIDPTDKRNVKVYLTPKSEPFIKNLNKSHIELHEEILEKIEPENRKTVISAMKDLNRALNLWIKKTSHIKQEVEHV